MPELGAKCFLVVFTSCVEKTFNNTNCSVTDRLKSGFPSEHPLRPIRKMVDAALRDMSPRFDVIYGEDGRKSIPPERLLRALLLQLLYSIRSERMLMEQLDYYAFLAWRLATGEEDGPHGRVRALRLSTVAQYRLPVSTGSHGD
jgi:transposase